MTVLSLSLLIINERQMGSLYPGLTSPTAFTYRLVIILLSQVQSSLEPFLNYCGTSGTARTLEVIYRLQEAP